MGLFSFLKKKQDIALPSQTSSDASNLFKNDADLNLPPLPSSFDALATLPGTSDPSFSLPSLEHSTQDANSGVLLQSFPSTNAALIQKDAQAMHDLDLPPLYQSLAPLGDFKLPDINDTSNTPVILGNNIGKQSAASIDEDTLNNLFLKDTDWKEPDWTTFEPYHEDTIEQPQQNDFGIVQKGLLQKTDLPEFDEFEEKSTPAHIRDAVDIYVQGTDCIKIRQEVGSIEEILATQEIHTKKLEEINMHEQLFTDAKNNMEFIQKRLMHMDRKLFP